MAIIIYANEMSLFSFGEWVLHTITGAPHLLEELGLISNAERMAAFQGTLLCPFFFKHKLFYFKMSNLHQFTFFVWFEKLWCMHL